MAKTRPRPSPSTVVPRPPKFAAPQPPPIMPANPRRIVPAGTFTPLPATPPLVRPAGQERAGLQSASGGLNTGFLNALGMAWDIFFGKPRKKRQ